MTALGFAAACVAIVFTGAGIAWLLAIGLDWFFDVEAML